MKNKLFTKETLMKVYVLFGCDHEGGSVLGIYADKERAEVEANRLTRVVERWNRGIDPSPTDKEATYYDEFKVVEKEVIQ